MLDAEEVSRATVFPLCEDPRLITGEVMAVDAYGSVTGV